MRAVVAALPWIVLLLVMLLLTMVYNSTELACKVIRVHAKLQVASIHAASLAPVLHSNHFLS